MENIIAIKETSRMIHDLHHQHYGKLYFNVFCVIVSFSLFFNIKVISPNILLIIILFFSLISFFINNKINVKKIENFKEILKNLESLRNKKLLNFLFNKKFYLYYDLNNTLNKIYNENINYSQRALYLLESNIVDSFEDINHYYNLMKKEEIEKEKQKNNEEKKKQEDIKRTEQIKELDKKLKANKVFNFFSNFFKNEDEIKNTQKDSNENITKKKNNVKILKL